MLTFFVNKCFFLSLPPPPLPHHYPQGFPEFGATGASTDTCKTGAINTAEIHGHSGLRSEMNYESNVITTQWSTTRSSFDPKVLESVLRPVYIDWEDWTSCEWCLYGDAMPSKCVKRVDPFANPAQYSYSTYFGTLILCIYE